MVNHPSRKKIENTLFPGRFNYTGPTKGWFGFLHHKQLCEKSHDVNERIDYVKKNKPKNEVAIRLHNMIYLGQTLDHHLSRAALDADYEAKRDALDADALYADYGAKVAFGLSVSLSGPSIDVHFPFCFFHVGRPGRHDLRGNGWNWGRYRRKR